MAFVDEQKFKPGDREAAKSYFHIPAGRKVIFFGAARMDEKRKGMALLMSCFNRMKPFLVEKQIMILSAGSGIPEMNGVPVLQAGYLKEEALILAYRAADVFVLSSAWEGFGLVVAEAMATEKVVVATNSGGVKEVVGECGLLVTPQNSEALAHALEKALNMPPEQAKVLGKKARQRIIENFSIDNAVKKWLEIYSAAGTRME
jgi:glycosyltransferase involved in cell wall biosynthesis